MIFPYLMLFTWAALPVLIATLAGADPALGAPLGSAAEEDSPISLAASTAEAPMAMLRGDSGKEAESRFGSEQRSRRGHPTAPTAEAPDEAPTSAARVHHHALALARLAFTPQLSRAITGFLSAYSTACPPPAAA